MSAPQTAASRAPEPHSPRQRTRMILLVVVPLIAAAIALVFYLKGGRYVSTDNAYVKADKVPVSAEVSGAVRDVLVHENQAVSAGQALFRLDPAPFQVAVAKAEAKLAQARTDLSALQASYREKQAEIALARTRLAFANRDQKRQADLVTKHFISASRYDDAKQNTELAAQQIAALQQDLKRIAETLGGSINSDITRHPSYLAAAAELDQAKLDLAHVEVHASLPGTVGKLPKPGQYVTAGTVVTTLVASANPWIEANFPETDLTHVLPGQPVSIRVDTYPSLTWHGVVDSLSPATGSEFSVIPAQNATGNWVKITQRVPVRIRLEPRPNAPQLRAGLSTEIEIDTGHRRRLLGLSL